jgi:hypothetical protein
LGEIGETWETALHDAFGTSAIEAGVDIPTVAAWLGHADGGALLMRVCAHHRRAHSVARAAKVLAGTWCLKMTKTRHLGKQCLVSQFTATPHPVRRAQDFGRHPYTEPPVVSLYISRLPSSDVLEKLGLRSVSDAGRVWFYIPTDEGVFLEGQTIETLPLATDAQIYIDLLYTGLRGPDQAQALRDWEGFCRP